MSPTAHAILMGAFAAGIGFALGQALYWGVKAWREGP
jgi:hypothetical protein